jgi:hypothetical protein
LKFEVGNESGEAEFDAVDRDFVTAGRINADRELGADAGYVVAAGSGGEADSGFDVVARSRRGGWTPTAAVIRASAGSPALTRALA